MSNTAYKVRIGRCCLAAVLIMFMLIMIIPTIVHAESLTADLFNFDSPGNMAVTIYYDSEKPDISFIAPDGSIYDENNLETETGDMVICYYIPDAMAGEWKIVYDKLSNNELEVNCAPYAVPISITQFKADITGEQSADLSFDVSSNSDGIYNYRIFAAVLDTDGKVSGTRKLLDGTWYLNQTADISVRLDSLQTYDEYYFYLDVWRVEYGIEVNDTKLITDSFSVSNQSTPDAPEQEMLYAEIDLTNSLLTLNWDIYNNIWCDEYVLAVFDTADYLEPIYANSFAADLLHKTTISLPDDSEKVRVELSYIKNGMTSNPLVREIPIKTGVEFNFPENDVVSSNQISIGYSTDYNIDASVNAGQTGADFNDIRIENIILNGSGSFSVILDDFDNEIVVSFSLDDYNTYFLSKRISVDTIAPRLFLPENDAAIFVESDTFDIVGAAEPGCMVTINNIEVSINEDNTFLMELSLVDGENEFIVNARDIAGNVSSQIVIINKLSKGETVGSIDENTLLKYLPMICAFLASLVLIILVIILGKLYTKRKFISRAYAIISSIRDTLFLFTIISVGVTVFAFIKYMSLDIIASTEKLFSIVQDSVQEAYSLLNKHSVYGQLRRIGMTASLAGVVLFIVMMLIAKKLKHPKSVKDTKSTNDIKGYKSEENISETSADITNDAVQVSLDELEIQGKISEYICPICDEKYEEPVKFCANCGNQIQV